MDRPSVEVAALALVEQHLKRWDDVMTAASGEGNTYDYDMAAASRGAVRALADDLLPALRHALQRKP